MIIVYVDSLKSKKINIEQYIQVEQLKQWNKSTATSRRATAPSPYRQHKCTISLCELIKLRKYIA